MAGLRTGDSSVSLHSLWQPAFKKKKVIWHILIRAQSLILLSGEGLKSKNGWQRLDMIFQGSDTWQDKQLSVAGLTRGQQFYTMTPCALVIDGRGEARRCGMCTNPGFLALSLLLTTGCTVVHYLVIMIKRCTAAWRGRRLPFVFVSLGSQPEHGANHRLTAL